MSVDADRLEAWNRGDRSAGEALFDTYFDRVYAFFASKVRGGVDDLTQETFLACVEQRYKLRDASSFEAFLFGVARRRLYRRWRDEYSGPGVLDVTVRSVADIVPSPSTHLRVEKQASALLDALRHLPAELHVAIELYYWEGFTTVQIAEVLEIPEGTSRSRLRRARERLRELLEQRGVRSDSVEEQFRRARHVWFGHDDDSA